MIDALLNTKYSIAKENGIQFLLKIFIPEELPVNVDEQARSKPHAEQRRQNKGQRRGDEVDIGRAGKQLEQRRQEERLKKPEQGEQLRDVGLRRHDDGEQEQAEQQVPAPEAEAGEAVARQAAHEGLQHRAG